MKKWLVLIGLLFILVVSACSNDDTSSTDSSEGVDNEPDSSDDAEDTEDEYADYPEKPIDFIIQYGAGGATDLVFRPVLQRMEEELGEKILVQNVTEGGGIEGAQELANADTDGYTAGVISAGQTVMAPLFREVPVSLDDYEVAGALGAYLYGIIVPIDAPYDDFEGFIEHLESNEGDIVASTIPSNVYEIFYSWLRDNYDVDFSTIPFDSATDTSVAVQDGSADFSVGLTSVDNDRIESEEIKLIAPLGDTRWPIAPDLETMQEQGYDDVMVATTLGMGLPEGTPEPIVEKWEDALKVALDDPEIIEILENFSTEPAYMPGDDFVEYLNDLDASFKNMLGEDE